MFPEYNNECQLDLVKCRFDKYRKTIHESVAGMRNYGEICRAAEIKKASFEALFEES